MGAEQSTSITRRSVIRLTGSALALPVAPFHIDYLENRRMPFTPKFVDLVRNFTTTTGTGDFVLGAAVTGYAGFASALQAGDSFYYSAIGVEKPAEREVGRGTLLATGRISREPISGSKTSFTSGTKTISLIAAAEWFTSVQAGGGSGASAIVVASKSALASAAPQTPALLTESGSEGIFVFDATSLTAAVAADTRKAVHIAPESDATGASGAWVRKFAGPKPASWFGAKGDGTTDDSAALQAWLDSGGHLSLPAGEYFCSATLILRKHAIIDGEGYGFDARRSGYDEMPGSRIRFPAGVAGLDVQPQQVQTDVATVLANFAASVVQEGAMHSRIRNLALLGGGTGAAATGLKSRTVVHLENVHILQFAGKAFDISATSDTPDGNDYGNANQCTLTNCHAKENGSHGFHLRGRDVNACTLVNCNAQLNGGWGLLDESLLGNSHIQPHFATNALGAIKAIGTVAGNKFDRPYIEVGTGSNCQIGGNNTIIGSDLSAANAPPDAPPAQFAPAMATVANLKWTWNYTSPGAIAGYALAFRSTGGLTLQGEGSSADFTVLNKTGETVANVPTGSRTLSVKGELSVDYDGLVGLMLRDTAGGSGGQIGIFTAGQRQLQIYGGGGAGYISADTLVLRDSATATDIRATISASGLNLASGKVLQVNGTTVIDGSRNGAFAAVAATGAVTSSGGGVGYSAGAGGTVTQTSSKSTGATLHKLSGQVTMSGAALAANTTVSFTLTNNQIAATDLLVLNHASGGTAGAYLLNAQCGAGSAVINVRNVTAGSLSEAIVIRFAVIKAVTG